jgi:hypothetical protein
MIEWLAIIVVCVSGKCGFLADTKTPYYSEPDCRKMVFAMAEEMSKRGVEVSLMSCIPIRWVKA